MAGVEQVIGWLSSGIVTLGGGKFLVDVLRSKATNRKTSAEGEAILLNSASEYARQLVDDQAKLRREFDAYRHRADALERRRQAALRSHAYWDGEVWRKLVELGVEISHPPPFEIEESA